ncbi:unnamed protein product [Peronospora destructor]|uniref:Uncharacterized protein n=1 Tax=Peronospora destructor TaxID=86335 RepID=A0AAV0VA54_9STRA|nr:unnamed protein product [Peronospora destructor]
MLGEVSRLLLLGPDKDSNLEVASKLCELCGDSTSDTLDDDKLVVLNLQTKYYHARVEVHLHQVLDNEPEPPLHHELRDYEALICVVNAKKKEQFLHMRLLTMALSLWPWTAWHTEPMIDNAIDEKQGIERVLEALHCNMWRSMEMNPSQSVTATSLQVATEDIEKKTDSSRVNTLLQALKIPGDPGTSAGNSEGDDNENDIDMNQFNALISEVQAVRNQGQLLTDEERRDRAAKVAIKLWNLLGEDSGSDSD